MARSTNFFGQSKDFSGNQYVNFPVNNPIAANEYANYVQKSIPSSQVEYGRRKILKWLVPERGVVEMYINPQSIAIHEQKSIKADRTKGGFVVQYWGEELINISINGHTGSSGIEGINVLRDIYRGEHVAFDVLALESLARAKSQDENFITAAVPGLGQIFDLMKDLGEQVNSPNFTIPKPTLGFYASSVEMYWMGEVYRGFFEKFDVTEDVQNLGIFTYSIGFKATQRRGLRRNYLPWHHTANAGPSDHDIIPYTFGNTLNPALNTLNELLRKNNG